jgi:hypothetical protein
MYLTLLQRQDLREASAEGIKAVERQIELLQKANPQAFHTEQTLPLRIFHHEPPRPIPNSGFVDSIASGRTAQAMNQWKQDRTQADRSATCSFHGNLHRFGMDMR